MYSGKSNGISLFPLNFAIFKRVKHSKINSLLKEASSYDMSLGDFIFDMLADIHDQSDDVVSKYFE